MMCYLLLQGARGEEDRVGSGGRMGRRKESAEEKEIHEHILAGYSRNIQRYEA